MRRNEPYTRGRVMSTCKRHCARYVTSQGCGLCAEEAFRDSRERAPADMRADEAAESGRPTPNQTAAAGRSGSGAATSESDEADPQQR